MGWDETLTRAQLVKIIITAMGYGDRRSLLPLTPGFQTLGATLGFQVC